MGAASLVHATCVSHDQSPAACERHAFTPHLDMHAASGGDDWLMYEPQSVLLGQLDQLDHQVVAHASQ
jgi:hypothetical protein